VNKGLLGLTLRMPFASRILEITYKFLLFIFNHPNFAPPSGTIINPGLTASYGPAGAQITALVGSGGIAGVARQTQFSLKLLF
jgi:hypothetical protein